MVKEHAKSAGLRTMDSLMAVSALEEVSRSRRHFEMIGERKLEVPSYCLCSEQHSSSGAPEPMQYGPVSGRNRLIRNRPMAITSRART